jgi:DNA-nicking Smr family endonuclease
MGRKNRPHEVGDGDSPRRGKRRSIRLDAEEVPDDGGHPRVRAADAPPAIQLRRLPVEMALERLALWLVVHRDRGSLRVLVVHGRGRNSPGGQPVLAPLVRQWLDDHPTLVAGWREAPPSWGGEGAVVVELRPRA